MRGTSLLYGLCSLFVQLLCISIFFTCLQYKYVLLLLNVKDACRNDMRIVESREDVVTNRTA